MTDDRFSTAWPLIEAALRADQAPERFIAAVGRRVAAVARGDQTLMPETDLTPIDSLPPIDPAATTIGEAALDRTVVIKLNGGLATSMGLNQPKSLLPIRGEQSFLELVIHQLTALNHRVPLVLIDSFATEAPTRAALDQLAARYPLAASVRSIRQHRLPKLDATTLEPASWPADPAKAWCPPGHGDLYLTLETSGLLDELLAQGMEYAFVSNIDNLGATLDPAVLGTFVQLGGPLAMEATDRTSTDRKGGHLAYAAGQLTLRESAQCPPADLEAFQDIARYRFFNTNSLWLHLPSIRNSLNAGDQLIDLPLIINHKPVDPAEPSSPAVIQLETAMGSAISALPGARAVHVPRSRFAPVKTTNELLIVRSDAYELQPTGLLNLAAGRTVPPHVALGSAYKLLADFERHFPSGAPSLVGCDELMIDGDVTFGANVVVRGSVQLHDNQTVPDGTVLEG